MTKKPKAPVIVTAILLTVIAVSWTGCKMHERYRRLHVLPEGLGVTRVVYDEEEAGGVGGPGDNETGVIVYELPDATARRIETGGLDYLLDLDRPHMWSATPIHGDDDWLRQDGLNTERPADYRPRLADFLDRYGFGIPIRADVLALADNALNTPGAYYKGTEGGGLIIVAPKARRIILAYAG